MPRIWGGRRSGVKREKASMGSRIQFLEIDFRVCALHQDGSLLGKPSLDLVDQTVIISAIFFSFL